MNRLFTPVLLALLFFGTAEAQNIGVGTTLPLMPLHIMKASNKLALFENTLPLDLDVSTGFFFKTGTGSFPYTGAVKSIGQNTVEARLGFFTYTSATADGLAERMTILDNGRVGIGTTNPGSFFEVNGSTGAKVNTITGATTLGVAHSVVLCNSVAPLTVTLPPAAGIAGRMYTIKNISLGAVTVDGNASETIDGALTSILPLQYAYIKIISDGLNWYILSAKNTL